MTAPRGPFHDPVPGEQIGPFLVVAELPTYDEGAAWHVRHEPTGRNYRLRERPGDENTTRMVEADESGNGSPAMSPKLVATGRYPRELLIQLAENPAWKAL